MSNDDHARLIATCARWEKLYAERLAENARLRALVSWLDGMLVDEADHIVIRAGIDRWRTEA